MAGGGRVCLGQFGAAHGVQGEVRLHSFTADPAAITSYGPLEGEDGRVFEIEAMRPAKDHFVAKIAGVADRNAAELLKNLKLYVPRARLPEPDEPDEFYHADLIEMNPASGGKTQLLPFDDVHVPTVDIAAGKIVVVPPIEQE